MLKCILISTEKDICLWSLETATDSISLFSVHVVCNLKQTDSELKASNVKFFDVDNSYFPFFYTQWQLLLLFTTKLKCKKTKCPLLIFMPSLMKIKWWICITFMIRMDKRVVKKWLHFIYLFIGCICCRTRKDELDGEVFDMLFTFSDFTAFKEMFLDYKAVSKNAHVTEKFRAVTNKWYWKKMKCHTQAGNKNSPRLH
jgi:hypothetical protein